MPDAIYHKPRYRTRTPLTPGKMIALCCAAVAGTLALFFLWSADGTTGGEKTANLTTSPATLSGTTCSAGQSIYAAPTGQPDNDGSIDRPLDLTTALSEKSPAKACDTIWLRGGTYRGAFKGALKGSDGKPIIVRQYPGEVATLDSGPESGAGLHVTGTWAWYWGFELTNSDPDRMSKEPGQWPGDLRRGTGVTVTGSHVRFINLIVHDLARGFEVNVNSTNTELYGNLIYHNGWQVPEGGARGDGIDTQNQLGSRRIIDNIIFNQFSNGIAIFGKFLDNITLEGNAVFNNGSISRQGITEARNILLGGAVVANNPVVKNNMTYNGQTNLGYGAGCSNGTVTDNYFAAPLIWVKCSAVMQRNTLYDASANGYGPLPTEYPDNKYHHARPSGVIVLVRRNQYEPGRANVAIFNWDKKSEVSVNLSEGGLAVGDRYEVRDAQNYFGKPTASGVYRGGTIELPMSTLTVSQPVGTVPVAPKHTLPEFAVFVILKVDAKSGS